MESHKTKDYLTDLQDKRAEFKELEDNNIYLEGIIDGQSTIEVQ